VKYALPTIPEFVLLVTHALITDCWVEEPGDPLFVEEIVNRLKKMKFKVTVKVNSSRPTALIKEIEG
jgi:hypothetical protein